MAEQRVREAEKLGFTACLMPKANLEGIQGKYQIRLIGVANIKEAMNYIIQKDSESSGSLQLNECGFETIGLKQRGLSQKNKKYKKLVDRFKILWYSNLAVEENRKNLKKENFKKMKKVLDKPEKM